MTSIPIILQICFIAYLIFQSAQKLIFDTEDPFANAKRYVPFYMGFAAFVMSLVTITKGLKHVGLHFSTVEAYGLAVAMAAIGLDLAVQEELVGHGYLDDTSSGTYSEKRIGRKYQVLPINIG